jgi:hypothetical protein
MSHGSQFQKETVPINVVKCYVFMWPQDCNGDGVTKCDDYVMIHYNGGGNCETPIDDKLFNNRYNKCRVDAIASE